ncbi:hypothetical protein VTP01DRAFT_1992 [Rhizomucor pusillus]|uniref:uncharacterized protein n=1 Tax=Rhizomucor pusillus TaxID=4840 RepID=UPI0037426656
MMAKFCEDHEIKTFKCMPLRTSWIPAHMQIDTKILATQTLKKPNNIDFDSGLWKQVVNFQSKPLQNQGADKSMAFKGTIFTDGFGVSILKQNFDSGFGLKPKKMKADTKSDFTYIHDLDKTTLGNIKPRTLFIDPGRRDLLYCMHQDSTSEALLTYRYTRNTKAIDTKATQYKKLRQRIKTNEVKGCEAKLSKHPAATVYIPKFLLYMKTRCEVSAIMSRHYQSLIYRKLRFRSYLYKKQADDKLAKAMGPNCRRSCLNHWKLVSTELDYEQVP